MSLATPPNIVFLKYYHLSCFLHGCKMASVSSGCRVLKSNKSAEISGFFSEYQKPHCCPKEMIVTSFPCFSKAAFPKGRV
jgi:hypothetical protein